MSTVTDFHTHILPGIDDGSASLEESIAMLKAQAAQGITHVVATPHFYAQHDTPQNFLERRDRAEDLLRAEMAKHAGLPTLSVGAEVYFFRGMSDSDILSRLTIDKKQCILVEMISSPWEEYAYRELEGIQLKQGLTPIIAHVDRYMGPFRQFRIPERLSQMPVMVQANSSFFLQRSTRRLAMRLLDSGFIQLLGSDCHNMTSRRPNLKEALELIRKQLGEEPLEHICQCEQMVLTGKTLV